MSANVESMFYVGEPPWHKEGKPLKEPPDTITAIKEAGLNWDVNKEPIQIKNGPEIKGYFGITRTDNGKVLGVVKSGYVPLQNRDAFNFFDPLLSSRFIEYETAGALGIGEIVWILAKLRAEGSFEVYRNDIVDKYLLLSNSHDGQSAVSIKFTPIRVVCQNTLNIALNSGQTTRIKHLTNMQQKLEDTRVAIENICRIYTDIEEHFKMMAGFKLNNEQLMTYFDRLYPVQDIGSVKTESQYNQRNTNKSIQDRLFRNFEEGLGVRDLGIGGTLWAAYNAVTEYTDHPINYKLGENKLLKRIWFGDGEVIKKKAYLNALDLLYAS